MWPLHTLQLCRPAPAAVCEAWRAPGPVPRLHTLNPPPPPAEDSKWLLSAGQDSTVRLWDVKTGEQLFCWNSHQPARACAFGKIDPRTALYSTDPFSTTAPSLRFVRIAELPQETQQDPTLQIDLKREQRCAYPIRAPAACCVRRVVPMREAIARSVCHAHAGGDLHLACRINRAVFTDGDAIALTVGEDGMARRWDVATGKVVHEAAIHAGIITDLQMSADGTHALTSSKDKTAKIIDPQTLEVVREYTHTRPVNSAAMSPLNHVRAPVLHRSRGACCRMRGCAGLSR